VSVGPFVSGARNIHIGTCRNGGMPEMKRLASFSRIACSLTVLSLAALLPAPAFAAGQTLTVWWNKGFYPAEDAALQKMIAEWEKKTGNKVNLTFYSTSDIPAKIISAITTGNVPDIAYADTDDFTIAPQQAWKGNLVDLSDVVEPMKDHYTKTALLSARLYNDAEKKRSYYAVPLKQQALHNFYWRPMVEQAGYTDKDIPQQWDAYWKFWETVQDKLRKKGQRVYGLGLPESTVDTDNFYTFNQFVLAYGGPLVTEDGQLTIGDPKEREAVIKALTLLTDAYKKGYVPSSAINWGDPDNNAAFFSKQIVMTNNASLSIPVAKKDDKKLYEHDIVTQAMPLAADGKPMTSLVAVKVAIVPKGAQHVDLAKDFLRFFIQPKNLDQYLVAAEGRWFPVMPEIIKDDPFWTNPKDPHIPVAVKQEVDGPTAPWPMAFNPAYAEVNAQEIWGKAEGEVLLNGVSPEKAVDDAFARIKDIFSQYKVVAQK
jgi:multiple sugar transport system substrate-binding protein